jgi:hypothetical protein
MINLDHVHFQHKTVIYFVQTFGNIYTIVPFCKNALRVFHAIAWLILLAHAQTNFPPVDDISNCSCRGMCLRDSGRSACPCKSVGHYCSSVCHANQFSGACMNQRKVLESDSDNSEDNKSDNSDVSMRPVSEL